MCLDVTGKQLQTAEKDIVCYKLLFEGVKGKGVLSTAFQSAIVELGKVYQSDLIVEVNDDRDELIDIGLHSFVSREKLEISGIGFNVIAECVIPKGSEYYLGAFWGIPSYASAKLRYKKIIWRRPGFDLRND